MPHEESLRAGRCSGTAGRAPQLPPPRPLATGPQRWRNTCNVRARVGRSRGATTRQAFLLTAAIALLGLGRREMSAPIVADAQRPPPPILPSYAVDDRRADVPWTPVAGRFGRARDVSVAPDGTLFVLDTALDAVHRLGPAGEPRSLQMRAWGANPDPDTAGGDPPMDDTWRAVRLDVGSAGRPHVLVTGPVSGGLRAGKVVVLESGDGSGSGGGDGGASAEAVVRTIALTIPAAERYADLAVAPDGHVFVVHTSGDIHNRGSYGIDVLSPTGLLVERAVPDDVWIPVSIDIAADGAIWVVGRATHDHVPGSTAEHGQDAVHGYAYDAGLRPRRTISVLGAMDVSVGAAGLLVSRDVEIVRLAPEGGAEKILHAGPLAERTHFTEPPLGAQNVYALDQHADGEIVAATDHCSMQGLTLLPAGGSIGAGPAAVRLVGGMDQPRLAGPLLPWRIAAQEGVALLQERVIDPPRDADGAPREPVRGQPIVFAPHSVQRWDADGGLDGQIGACGGWTDPLAVRDVALDGDRLYTLTEDRFRWRPDVLGWGAVADTVATRVEPVTETWLAVGATDPDAAAHGFALDAWGAVLVALDLGLDRVHVLQPDGPTGDRPLRQALPASDPDRAETLPRDVATHEDAIFVLDADGTVRALRGTSEGLAARTEAAAREQMVGVPNVRRSAPNAEAQVDSEQADSAQAVSAQADSAQVGSGQANAARGVSALPAAVANVGWSAPGAPRAIALDGSLVYGPGRVTLLHDGGWLSVHEAQTGAMRAVVAPHDAHATARDIDVDDQGDVFVAWIDGERAADRTGTPPRTAGAGTDVRRAGIRRLHRPQGGGWPWREPEPSLVGGTPPVRGACLVAPAITAPAVASSGRPFTLTLHVDAFCPPEEAPLDLALVVDISRAAAARGGGDRTRAAAIRLLSLLGGEVRVSLTTFDDDVVDTMSADAGVPAVARRLAAVEATAGAGRGITVALRTATAQLGVLPPREDARRVVLVLTDGRIALPDRATLRTEDVDAHHVLLLPGDPLPWSRVQAWEDTWSAAGAPRAHVHLDATPEGLASLARTLRAGAQPAAELAEVVIDLGLPPGWEPVAPVGAAPGTGPTRVGDRLRWSVSDVRAGSAITWTVQASSPGLRAAAVTPIVRWRDAYGNEGGWSLRAPTVAVDGGHTLWLPRANTLSRP